MIIFSYFSFRWRAPINVIDQHMSLFDTNAHQLRAHFRDSQASIYKIASSERDTDTHHVVSVLQVCNIANFILIRLRLTLLP